MSKVIERDRIRAALKRVRLGLEGHVWAANDICLLCGHTKEHYKDRNRKECSGYGSMSLLAFVQLYGLATREAQCKTRNYPFPYHVDFRGSDGVNRCAFCLVSRDDQVRRFCAGPILIEKAYGQSPLVDALRKRIWELEEKTEKLARALCSCESQARNDVVSAAYDFLHGHNGAKRTSDKLLKGVESACKTLKGALAKIDVADEKLLKAARKITTHSDVPRDIAHSAWDEIRTTWHG